MQFISQHLPNLISSRPTHGVINHLMYAAFLSSSACRSWRLVSSHLRQVPVAGGRPGRADQDHRRRHAGSLRQLRLADVVPADVQRHGTQLEAVQTGGQYRGECILRWTVTKHTETTSMSRRTVTAYGEIINLY